MIQPQFNDLNNPETIKKHIEEIKSFIGALPHAEILDKLIEQFEPLDFAKLAKVAADKIKYDDYSVVSIDNVIKVASKNRWGLCKNKDFIYLYNGMYWLQIDSEHFQKFLGDAADKMSVPLITAKHHRFRKELYQQFIATAYLPTPISDKDKVLINLQNGTFEITKNGTELKPFDRSDFITYQLSFDYNPTADAPQFKTYLDRVLPDKDSQKVLAEYLGYIFIKHGSRLKIESALILYGSGANGKSVFFEVVNALLGNDNVSNYSLQELTDNSGYYRAMIANKLVNYASEINGKLETSYFKKMVSGEPVSARLPYGRPMELTQYAKFIFNCNELPKDVEHTNAFFRRWVIIPFDVTIPKDEQDNELHNKIIDAELSGVFNWVLEGLQRLLLQKKFTKSIAIQKAVEQYELESDSVQMFFTESDYKNSATEFSKLKDLFFEYRSYCIECGYVACSLKTFSKRLKKLGYVSERKTYGMAVNAIKNNPY